MPFIPHTPEDLRAMLERIGIPALDGLFDEIPAGLRLHKPPAVPPALGEAEVARLMARRAVPERRTLNFIGAGAYEHHIPAAVWQLATRGEFYSAYTPYQAEASQGTLQVLYEFQTMMASLAGLDVSNAGLYDGASALGEALLMAVRAHRGARRVLMPATVHPAYRRVVRALVKHQGIEVIEVPYCTDCGHTLAEALEPYSKQEVAALVIPQPNFFGVLEPVDDLVNWIHARGGLAVGLVNPVLLGLLKPPGEWGESGADIAVGEGQPLGIPLSGGGPYFGFMTCKAALVRQMPGRIVGATLDKDGRPGYTLTLQAREQHIRRSKATSNICTNQGLMVTAATIHMALLGSVGLRRVAAASCARTQALAEKLTAIPGVSRLFAGSHAHEAVIRLPASSSDVLRSLLQRGILGGLDLRVDYPELGHALLVCATETKLTEDLDCYAEQLQAALQDSRVSPC